MPPRSPSDDGGGSASRASRCPGCRRVPATWLQHVAELLDIGSFACGHCGTRLRRDALGWVTWCMVLTYTFGLLALLPPLWDRVLDGPLAVLVCVYFALWLPVVAGAGWLNWSVVRLHRVGAAHALRPHGDRRG